MAGGILLDTFVKRLIEHILRGIYSNKPILCSLFIYVLKLNLIIVVIDFD